MNKNLPLVLLWGALILFLIFGYIIPVLLNYAVNSDMSILISFAGRMYEGHKASEYYFEANPPMSMILYLPEVMISRFLNVPVYHMHIYYVLFFIGVSFLLFCLLLRLWKADDLYAKHIIAMVFLMAMFFAPMGSIGDRDHIIVLGLAPFIILQLHYLQNTPVSNRLKIPTLIFGAFVVLIKPHYGLIPTFMLAWRFYKTRDFKIVFHSDFLALAIGVLAYAGVILVFFPDFLTIILPDIITLYASVRAPEIWYVAAVYSVCVFLVLFAAYEMKVDRAHMKQLGFFTLLFMLFLITYVAQGKGLFYQNIGYMTSLFIMVTLSLYYMITDLFKHKSRHVIGLCTSSILIFAFLLMQRIPSDAMTHEKFKEMPISWALETYCDDPCSFFFFYDYSDMIHQLEIYHDAFHAYRMTSIWFLPKILDAEYVWDPKEDGPKIEKMKKIKKRHLSYMAEDFKRFKPSIIIEFEKFILNIEAAKDMEYMEYFSEDDELNEIFSHYELVDELIFHRSLYYPGFVTVLEKEEPLSFKIYKLKTEEPSQ